MKKMRINETFLSLQGEGRFTGMPAFFLRLSGCNLQCPFCDTQHQSYTERSEEDLVAEALRHKPRHIIITGGEPALQLTQTFIDKLHGAGFFVHVETNGTRPLPEDIDWVTCSPKPPHPIKDGLRIDELKVLYTGKDFSLPDYLAPYIAEAEVQLYLQPLDTGNQEQNHAILLGAIAYVMEHPEWKLSLQTHKMIGIK